MATVYGSQYTDAYVSVPSVKIAPGLQSGEVKFMYFSYALTAILGANDIVKLGKIPKNAMVIDAVLTFPDLGTTGVLDLGWAASAELSGGSAVEAADADGFLVGVDVNAAANTVNTMEVAGAAVPGFLKEFNAECDLQLVATTATTATSGTIKGYIKYVTI